MENASSTRDIWCVLFWAPVPRGVLVLIHCLELIYLPSSSDLSSYTSIGQAG